MSLHRRETRDRECRILSERQIEASHVETGKVHAVIEAMAIGIVSEKMCYTMPRIGG